jgi:acyl-CoA synthetase (AMP-forming)/AMP-acid ligase II/aryl carrier-like protein
MAHALTETLTFTTLTDAMVHWARERADEPALTFVEGTGRTALTYAQLHERALCIAARLATLTRPGDRAVLVFDQGVDYLAAFLGCCYARVVAVTGASPDEFRRQQRLVSVVQDCGAQVLLTAGDSSSQLAPVLAGIGRDMTLLDVRAVADDPQAARLDAPLPAGADDLMFLQYTSGSTAAPKGVMLSHHAVAANLRLILQLTRQHRGTVHVSWLPLFHDMGLILMALGAFYGGCPLYLMAPAEFLRNPLRWLELISQVRGTMTAAPDFAYRMCVERATPEKLAALDLSSLEILLSGSEPIRLPNVEAFYQAFQGTGLPRQAMYAGYGMAEVAVCATLGPNLEQVQAFDARSLELDGSAQPCPRDAAHARLVSSCGRVDHGGYDWQIVDPQSLQALEPGRVGEIWLSGPSVGQGYWNNAAATRETFQARIAGLPGGYFRTGDLGFVREGELYICGRQKEMMIVRGRNLFPGDVCAIAEQVTDTMRGRRAAAFGVEGDDGEDLVLVCAARVTADTHRAVAARITAEVTRQAGVMPAAVLFVQNRVLKRTTSGKVQHGAMRREFLQGALPVDGYVINRSHASLQPLLGPQATPAESAQEPAAEADDVPGWAVKAVCDAGSELLSGAALRAGDNLFEHGLDSLRAMQLLEKLQARLAGARALLSLADLAELKTPREVARALLALTPGRGAGAQQAYMDILV